MTEKPDHDIVEAEPDQEATDAATGQEPSSHVPRDGMFCRLQKYGHRKFPSVIPAPNLAAILRDSRSNDDQDNAETEPPAEEAVDTRCIWVSVVI